MHYPAVARLLTLAICLCILPGMAVHAEDPWADAVLEFVQGPNAPAGPYSDPAVALGPPSGGAVAAPSNTSLVSLGSRDGYLVLAFDTPVTDDPANPMGLDCIVYGNAFHVGGNPQIRFQEVALIEISQDVNGNGQADDAWYLIPGSRDFAYPIATVVEPSGQGNSESEPFTLMGHITNPNTFDADAGNDSEEYTWGYADMNPTLSPYLDNHVRPGDPFTVGHEARTGGGDAFDIAWAVDADGQPAGISQFDFIRIRAFIERQAGPLGYYSPEVDAVADVAPDTDTDGDGIVDEFETRVAGTDPARPESTILPLEIPSDEGGSPAGALLGTAADTLGNRLRLYSAGERDLGLAHTLIVDLTVLAPPAGDLPDGSLALSGAALEVVSSEVDFLVAQVEAGEVTLAYTSGDIAGLDEEQLQPLRFDGSAYTSAGITQVSVNGAANQVSFRTSQAGAFALASVSGSGDAGSATGPQGAIVLSAQPVTATVADPVNQVHVQSDEILDDQSQPVVDSTLFTVSASRGTVATADADGALPGIQVASVAGEIAFDITAPAQAGAAVFQASSVEGAAFGELVYTFLAGPPAGNVAWQVGVVEGEGPYTGNLTTRGVSDQYGNVVPDGTLLTVAVTGAQIASGDADLNVPGHQVVVNLGRAALVVEVASLDAYFTVDTFVDDSQLAQLGADTLRLDDGGAAQLPVAHPVALLTLFAGILAYGASRVRRR